jgi:protocatechuate 3,4-dioxygenase beta subunit
MPEESGQTMKQTRNAFFLLIVVCAVILPVVLMLVTWKRDEGLPDPGWDAPILTTAPAESVTEESTDPKGKDVEKPKQANADKELEKEIERDIFEVEVPIRPDKNRHAEKEGQCAIEGTVSDTGGAPLRATVKLAATEDNGMISTSRSVGTQATPADGHYGFAGLKEGHYQVVATAEGMAMKGVFNLEVKGKVPVRVDFRLVPQSELSGTVRNGAGDAIAGIAVFAITDSGSIHSEIVYTGEDGRYRVPNMPAGTCIVTAQSNEHARGTRTDVVAPAWNVDFVLYKKSGCIRGRVIGPHSRLEELMVIPQLDPKGGASDWMPMRSMKGSTRTELDGSFVVSGLEPGLYMITANAKGCLGRRVRSVEVKEGENTEGVEIRLSKEILLRGRVVRKSDKTPIKDAMVVAAFPADDRPSPSMLDPSAVRCPTGADGRFVLDSLIEGEATVMVEHKDYGNTSRTGIVIREGEEPQELVFLIEDGGIVAGRVLDSSGKPVKGVQVMFMKQGSPGVGFTVKNVETDGEGRYRSKPLGAGLYSVTVAMKEGGLFGKIKTVKVLAGETVTVDFGDTASGCTVMGRVTSNGKGVKDCVVGLISTSKYASGKGASALNMSVAKSGKDGSFRLTGVRPGRYYLLAQVIGERSVSRGRATKIQIEIHEGMTEKRVDLPFPCGAIRGKLMDKATGKPIVGATIMVIKGKTEQRLPRNIDDFFDAFGGQSLSDAQGGFEVGGLAEGQYRIEIQKAGYASEIITPWTVTSSAGRALEVMLDAESRIIGTITDEDGRPVKGAVLVLADVQGRPVCLSPSSKYPLSNDKGGFEIGGVKAGSYRVHVEGTGFGRLLTEVIAVGQNGSIERTFWLRKEGRIKVQVFQQGALLEGAEVLLFDASGTEVVNRLPGKDIFTGIESQATDEEGYFSLLRLAAGTYTVKVRTPDGRTQSKSCNVLSGSEIPIVIEFD